MDLTVGKARCAGTSMMRFVFGLKHPENTTRQQKIIMCRMIIFLPNVQDEPRPQLARKVRLGAHSVTAVVVGSSAWLGSVVFI